MTTAFLDYIQIENAGEPAQESNERIAVLVLNRSKQMNAFDKEMIQAVQSLLQTVAQDTTIRVLLIRGEGRHFCAGADLNWMQKASRTELLSMQKMYHTLEQLNIPKVALVRGCVFGGGLGLIACCDYAIAVDSAQFALSEVKIGLIPAVILPYLQKKMTSGTLGRYALSGQMFSADEAVKSGLVQLTCAEAQLNEIVEFELNSLLSGAPEAQAAFLNLNRQLNEKSVLAPEITVEAILSAKLSLTAQHGFEAFLQKKTPDWSKKISKRISL